MKRRLLFGETERAELALLDEDGRPVEFFAERKGAPSLLYNVYRARVENARPNGLTFLSLGGDGGAVGEFRKGAYKAGDLLTVTVVRTAGGKKLPKAEEGIYLPSASLFYRSGGAPSYVSGKLSENVRNRLYALSESAGAETGFTFRTIAGERSGAEILKEIAAVSEEAKRISEAARRSSAPAALKRHSFRERAAKRFQITDRETESVDFEAPPYREILENALEKRVGIPGVGNLIIEKTEAFLAVDVNTGAEFRYGSEEETAYRTNLAAAPAVAAEVRLRNLAGTILIDMVSMRDRKHRDDVLDALCAAFLSEQGRTEATGYTKTGVYEIARGRIGNSLWEAFEDDAEI